MNASLRTYTKHRNKNTKEKKQYQGDKTCRIQRHNTNTTKIPEQQTSKFDDSSLQKGSQDPYKQP